MSELDSSLSSLRTHTAQPERTADIRAKCHAALSKRPSPHPLEPAMMIGACAVYLLTVIRTALSLYGF